MKSAALCLMLLAARASLAQTASAPSAQAQVSTTAASVHHDANFDAERAQANQLYLSQKALEALPLYEDLCRQDPTIAVFAERHAAGLLAKSSTISDPAQRQEILTSSFKELQRAESLGDHSPYVESILGTLSKSPIGLLAGGPMGALPLTVGYFYNGNSQAQPLFQQGEAAFGHNDLPAALKLYLAAAQADPRWYSAALYCGDIYYRLKDYTNAGLWYAKAVAIDPDRETAYRYWGDALFHAGDSTGGKAKFEQAIAAEPYSKSSMVGLQQWAIQTHTTITLPRVARPQFNMKDGQFTETALTTDGGTGDSSWIVYRKARLAHGPNVILNEWVMAGSTPASPDFHFVPSGYVHTLAEEVQALDAMLLDIHARLVSGDLTESKLDPELKTLLQIENDRMLEPFILLNFNDAALRHGYPEYRAGHREQVVAYIDRYWIGPPTVPGAPSPYVQIHP